MIVYMSLYDWHNGEGVFRCTEKLLLLCSPVPTSGYVSFGFYGPKLSLTCKGGGDSVGALHMSLILVFHFYK